MAGIVQEIRSILGPDAAALIESIIVNAQTWRSSLLTPLIGLVILLFGASRVFQEMRSVLNVIWRVPPEPSPQRGLITLLKGWALAVTMVIGSGILLVFTLTATTSITMLANLLGDYISLPLQNLWYTNEILSLLVTILLFTVLYRFLPATKIYWKEAFLGAIISGILFSIGKYIIGYYLGVSTLPSLYGTAATIMFFLIWLYYSIHIILFGSMVAKGYALISRPEPEIEAEANLQPESLAEAS